MNRKDKKSDSIFKVSAHFSINFMISLSLALPWVAQVAWAQRHVGSIHERIVRSKEDADRLKGFEQHYEEQRRRDREREKGLAEFKKEKALEAKQREKDRLEFIQNRPPKVTLDREATPEYREELKRRLREMQKQELLRQEFVSERDERWTRESQRIDLTEAQELGVPERRERVEPSLRNMNIRSAKGSSGSSSSSNSGTYFPPPLDESNGTMDLPVPDFGPPPPPPPPPEFFEPEFPPPPPPGFEGQPDFEDPAFSPPADFGNGAPPFFESPEMFQ